MRKNNSHAYINKTYNEGNTFKHWNIFTQEKLLNDITIFRQTKTIQNWPILNN